MRRFALALLLLPMCPAWATPAAPRECGEPGQRHWQTVLKLASGPVRMSWTGVYLGHQAVCRLSYQNAKGQPRAMVVWGQPVPDPDKSLIAFSICADRGCDKTIWVADLVRDQLFRSDLPLTDEFFFLKLKWSETAHTLAVEAEVAHNGPTHEFTCWIEGRILCTQNGA